MVRYQSDDVDFHEDGFDLLVSLPRGETTINSFVVVSAKVSYDESRSATAHNVLDAETAVIIRRRELVRPIAVVVQALSMPHDVGHVKRFLSGENALDENVAASSIKATSADVDVAAAVVMSVVDLVVVAVIEIRVVVRVLVVVRMVIRVEDDALFVAVVIIDESITARSTSLSDRKSRIETISVDLKAPIVSNVLAVIIRLNIVGIITGVDRQPNRDE